MAVYAARKLLGVDVTRITSTQEHELGTKIHCNDGTTRRYVRAGAAITQYDALAADAAEGIYNFHPTPATASAPVVGVAPYDVTDNYYFWAIIKGPGIVKQAAAGVAAASILVTLAEAGAMDDTAASDANALGSAAGVSVRCVTPDTPSAGFATVQLY